MLYHVRLKAQTHTLLLVDDTPDDRFLMEKCFRAFNTAYRIQPLPNGREAIRYLKGEGKYADRATFEFPSYIITDLNMPQGDGFEVLEFLKKNPALSVIPVVMLSSSDEADDIRHAYLLGASSFFVKPHNHADLRKLLKKIHEYWAECEVPEVDLSGYAVDTDSTGKLGARFNKPKRPPAS